MDPIPQNESVLDPNFKFNIENIRTYFQSRFPLAFATGGILGLTTGFYATAGTSLALHGYTYSLGLGVASTAYFSGTFTLRNLRNRDDYINHAASGFLNGGWMVSAY